MAKNQKVLNFEKDLWKAADKLRGSVDASEYKHIVLGLIFLRYISDSFESRRDFLEKAVKDQNSKQYYTKDEEVRRAIIESKDEYLGQNVFFVPLKARWSYLQENATDPQVAKMIDGAMDLIEEENPKQLKGVLPKIYTRINVEPRTLGELINLFTKIPFEDEDHDKDILGRIYEYFLGQFASAEGKRGGEFYTPRCLVKLLVEILEPFENCRVFDPACGSGGMLVQSQQFLKIHRKDPAKISFSGQEKNATTWKLCKMNLAIRGIHAQIELGDSYHDDKFPDLRADFVLTNPPFNVSDWGIDRIKNDPRIKYGLPPNSNANFMWMQHFIYHLAPDGVAGFVMANGALAVSGKEGEIRRKVIEDDLVDVIIACPPKLFYNVALPVSLWFLTKNKKNDRFRNRSGETLFIDARELYEPISRKQYLLTDEYIQKIAGTVRAWRGEEDANEYKDVPGFCKSTTAEEIAKNGFVLTPGRYVGIPPEPDDGIPFEVKLQKLTGELKQYFEEGEKLEKEILNNLEKLPKLERYD